MTGMTAEPRSLPYRAMLIGAVLVLLVGSAIGALFSPGAETGWYASLAKPAMNPPGWVFGVVWPILYLLIGAAGGLVWTAAKGSRRRRALFWFGLQLALNLAWTPVFFGMQQIALALGIILALNVAAVTATVRMERVRTLAAWLMVPYLVWIAFAAILNLRIWQLNPVAPIWV